MPCTAGCSQHTVYVDPSRRVPRVDVGLFNASYGAGQNVPYLEPISLVISKEQ